MCERAGIEVGEKEQKISINHYVRIRRVIRVRIIAGLQGYQDILDNKLSNSNEILPSYLYVFLL